MKKLAIILLALVVVTGCKNKNKTTGETEKSKVEAVATSMADYAGTYIGTTPCADCQGINIVITLDNKGNFTRKMKYLNDRDGNNEFTDKGTYTVGANGTVLTLDKEKYRVGPNSLTILDQEGKVIEGELAELYVLTKQLEGIPTEDYIDEQTEKTIDEAAAKRRATLYNTAIQ